MNALTPTRVLVTGGAGFLGSHLCDRLIEGGDDVLCVDNPVQTTKTSVHGAINMLGLAKRVRARILQASTSEVCGDPALHPQREAYWGNVNPVGRRSCYDEGKRCAETLFMDYRRQHGLKVKVARIFNTYGPRIDYFDDVLSAATEHETEARARRAS